MVGIADGRETFRVDPDVREVGGFAAVDDRHVLVIGDELGGPLAVLAVEADGARLLGSAPTDFEADTASSAVVEGDTLVEGFIDDSPTSDGPDETSELVVLEIGDDGFTTRASTTVPAFAESDFSGGRVLVKTEEGVRVLSAKDLSEVASIDTGDGWVELGPNYILTVDQEAGQITQWR